MASFPEDPNAPLRNISTECGHAICPECEAHNGISRPYCGVCSAPMTSRARRARERLNKIAENAESMRVVRNEAWLDKTMASTAMREEIDTGLAKLIDFAHYKENE